MTFAHLAFDTQKEVDNAVLALSAFPGKLARKSLRKAARQSGTVVLRAAKQRAPKHQTGLFARSLTKKAYTRANQGIFMSIVGQKKSRAGGRGGKAGKGGFTARQIRKARAANSGISTGISGTGKAVPMHFTMRPIKRHGISRKDPTGAMYANIGANRRRMPLQVWRRPVRHPGVKNRDRWLNRAERQSRPTVQRIYASSVRQDVPRIASQLRSRYG